MKLLVAIVSCCLALAAQRPAGDDARVAAAVVDYRGGRYERALEVFVDELRQRGADAPAQLRLNAALCELRLLRSRDAEQWVAPLIDDDRFGADAAFALGLASFQHAERAVAAARLADAEPMAWAMATRAIQRAELLFGRAVELRPEWPEAVRNLERVLRRRSQIEAERDAAVPPDAKQEQAPEQPPPPEPERDEQPPEVVVPEVAQRELSALELAELQRRVAARQRDKLHGRQRRAAEAGAGRGRGW